MGETYGTRSHLSNGATEGPYNLCRGSRPDPAGIKPPGGHQTAGATVFFLSLLDARAYEVYFWGPQWNGTPCDEPLMEYSQNVGAAKGFRTVRRTGVGGPVGDLS